MSDCGSGPTFPGLKRPLSYTSNGLYPTPQTASLLHLKRPLSYTSNGLSPTPQTASLLHLKRPLSYTSNGLSPTPQTASLLHLKRPLSYTSNGLSPTPQTASLLHLNMHSVQVQLSVVYSKNFEDICCWLVGELQMAYQDVSFLTHQASFPAYLEDRGGGFGFWAVICLQTVVGG